MKSPYTLTLVPSASRTRLLLTEKPDELMRAILPPLAGVEDARAVTTVLEGLSLWFNQKLRVVLSADELETSFFLGLTDALGAGKRTLFFDVEVVTREPQRRGRRIRGIGDFAQLHQLELRAQNGNGAARPHPNEPW